MKARFANGVDRIFDAFGDVVESVTYTRKNEMVYNPTIDDVERTDTEYTLDMIINELSSDTLQLYTDVFSRAEFPSFYYHVLQGIFKQNQLVNTSGEKVEPQKGDTVTRPDGTIYTIVDFKQDPASATWTIIFNR